MNQNEEAFRRLREESSRSLILVRGNDFDHLARMTNDLRKIIDEDRNKKSSPK
jgi:hypothetical protein